MRRILLICMLLLAVAKPSLGQQDIGVTVEGFFYTQMNAEENLKQWLKAGGNPNSKNNRRESLVYVATGPKGGAKVLRLLLAAGANPNRGQGSYTPLMNAASWVNLEAVEILLAAGADPNMKNEDDKVASQLVGQAGGREQAVIALLRAAEQRGVPR